MFTYYLNDFSIESIKNIINSYMSREVPIIRKRFNYYNGEQAIKNKRTSGDRPNNQCVTNYCRTIADTFAGFVNIADAESPHEIIDNNLTVISDAVRDSIISGVGYILNYYSDSKLKLTKLHPTRTMVFRSPDIEAKVIGAATWNEYEVYENSLTNHYIDLYVYDNINVYTYRGTNINDVRLMDTREHYLKYIPIIEVHTDSHYDGVFDAVVDLQDSYNLTMSSYLDGRETFSDCFLVISGMGFDQDSADNLINDGAKIINLPVPGSSADYLVKTDSATDIVSILSTIKQNIFETASLPQLFDTQKFGVSSAEALKLRLLPFLNRMKTIKDNITNSLYYEILAIGGDINKEVIIYKDAIDAVELQNVPEQI